APATRIGDPDDLQGLKATVDIDAGDDVTAALVGDGRTARAGPPIRKGRRIAEVVALGSPQLVVRGSRVDVLVTPEPRPTEGGRTVLALEAVEVLDARPVAAEQGARDAAQGERVAASLLVTLRQAVYLAAAQDFARALRLLPRGDGDSERGSAGLSM